MISLTTRFKIKKSLVGIAALSLLVPMASHADVSKGKWIFDGLSRSTRDGQGSTCVGSGGDTHAFDAPNCSQGATETQAQRSASLADRKAAGDAAAAAKAEAKANAQAVLPGGQKDFRVQRAGGTRIVDGFGRDCIRDGSPNAPTGQCGVADPQGSQNDPAAVAAAKEARGTSALAAKPKATEPVAPGSAVPPGKPGAYVTRPGPEVANREIRDGYGRSCIKDGLWAPGLASEQCDPELFNQWRAANPAPDTSNLARRIQMPPPEVERSSFTAAPVAAAADPNGAQQPDSGPGVAPAPEKAVGSAAPVIDNALPDFPITTYALAGGEAAALAADDDDADDGMAERNDDDDDADDNSPVSDDQGDDDDVAPAMVAEDDEDETPAALSDEDDEDEEAAMLAAGDDDDGDDDDRSWAEGGDALPTEPNLAVAEDDNAAAMDDEDDETAAMADDGDDDDAEPVFAAEDDVYAVGDTEEADVMLAAADDGASPLFPPEDDDIVVASADDSAPPLFPAEDAQVAAAVTTPPAPPAAEPAPAPSKPAPVVAQAEQTPAEFPITKYQIEGAAEPAPAKPAEPAPPAQAASPEVECPPVTIQMEPGRFEFDKWQLRPELISQLDLVANKLRTAKCEAINIIGHTDRIGSKKYNQRLSERRAEAAKQYLVERQGISPDLISTSGKGKTSPVTKAEDCKGKRKKKLIACLSPDRRIEVTVRVTGQGVSKTK